MVEKKKKKLSMVVFSGDLDKLMGAFIIAVSAAASNMDVTMFFTFWGFRALKKENIKTGKSFMGRIMGLFESGGIDKAKPSKYNMGGIGRSMFKKMMASKNVASLGELRQMAVDMGAKLYPCQMSKDVLEIPDEALIDEAEKTVGAGFFVEQAANSDFTLFI
jgi:peroxiredoxin family protein